MPRAKKDKEVSLTKVEKKGKAQKQKIIEEVRKCVDSYERIFVLSIDNVRTNIIKDLRISFRDSRFFFGRNKVISLAFGRIPEEEYKDNLYKLSKKLSGLCTLMFTNRSVDEITTFFKSYKVSDFARSGNIATKDVDLDEGPLEYFPHSMEPLLRKLGLPVVLQKGVISLNENFRVCNKGDKLTPEQAKILKIFQMQLVEFRARLVCTWSTDGKFQSFSSKTKKAKDKKETVSMDIDV